MSKLGPGNLYRSTDVEVRILVAMDPSTPIGILKNYVRIQIVEYR